VTVRKNFDARYVDDQLRLVSGRLVGKTTMYAADGTVMAVRGLKEGTKDVDVVVESADDLVRLKKALTTVGYSKPNQFLEVAYQRMEAEAILENKDGFRWDVFERVVAGKFHLSPGMKSRARDYKISNEKLAVKLLSMEDVFLMKSVTEREGDLEDMAKIAQGGIDWGYYSGESATGSPSEPEEYGRTVCVKALKI